MVAMVGWNPAVEVLVNLDLAVLVLIAVASAVPVEAAAVVVAVVVPVVVVQVVQVYVVAVQHHRRVVCKSKYKQLKRTAMRLPYIGKSQLSYSVFVQQ